MMTMPSSFFTGTMSTRHGLQVPVYGKWEKERGKNGDLMGKKKQGAPGFEPGTSWSAVKCSTTELYPHIQILILTHFFYAFKMSWGEKTTEGTEKNKERTGGGKGATLFKQWTLKKTKWATLPSALTSLQSVWSKNRNGGESRSHSHTHMHTQDHRYALTHTHRVCKFSTIHTSTLRKPTGILAWRLRRRRWCLWETSTCSESHRIHLFTNFSVQSGSTVGSRRQNK